jgi:hypothetical protein
VMLPLQKPTMAKAEYRALLALSVAFEENWPPAPSPLTALNIP